MARGKYNLADDELVFGTALQETIETIKKAIIAGTNMQEACLPCPDCGLSQIEELAAMLTRLQEMHEETFTLKGEE